MNQKKAVYFDNFSYKTLRGIIPNILLLITLLIKYSGVSLLKSKTKIAILNTSAYSAPNNEI